MSEIMLEIWNFSVDNFKKAHQSKITTTPWTMGIYNLHNIGPDQILYKVSNQKREKKEEKK